VIYGRVIGEVVRGRDQAVHLGQIEAAMRRPVRDATLACHLPSDADHRPAVDQPVPEPGQELEPTSRSGSRTSSRQLDGREPTGQPVSVIVLVMAIYLAMSLVTSLLMNVYNRRVQVLER
jgi:hypothetical protein